MAAAFELSNLDRASAPFASVGVLFASWTDGTVRVGSFAVVGRNDILTATHVIFDPSLAGYASRLELYLAADYNLSQQRFDAPAMPISYGRAEIFSFAERVFQDSENTTFTAAESQFDVALIGLDREIGVSGLDMVTGFNSAGSGRIASLAVGYPASGTGMMAQKTEVATARDSKTYFSDARALGAGASGGPLLLTDGAGRATDQVIGVLSSGNALGSTWANLDLGYFALHRAMRENDGLLPKGSWGLQTLDRAVEAVLAQNPIADIGVYRGASVLGSAEIRIDGADKGPGDAFSAESLVIWKKPMKQAWTLKPGLEIRGVTEIGNKAFELLILKKSKTLTAQKVDFETGNLLGGQTRLKGGQESREVYYQLDLNADGQISMVGLAQPPSDWLA
jgi:V8-like Glu-specific endopeptidase